MSKLVNVVHSINYFFVTTSRDLSWNKLASNTVDKANNAFEFVKRTVGTVKVQRRFLSVALVSTPGLPYVCSSATKK